MKKITKILSLTAIVAGMVTPTILISTNSNNNNNINIDQENNGVDANETIETNNIDNDVGSDYKNDDLVVNNKKVGSIDTGIIINSDQCTVGSDKATDWMGITTSTGLVNFQIDEGAWTATIISTTAQAIASSNLKIPSSITYNAKTYEVTGINGAAFYNCFNLTGTLTIPASVTFIGEAAFNSCSGLTGALIIPESVTTIGNSAFEFCFRLTSLDLSNATSLVTIGDVAFRECYGLTGTLTISASVTSIGDRAFDACSFLTGLDLSNATNLMTINSDAFKHCTNLTGALTIPASLTIIAEGAFTLGPHFTSINVDNSNSSYIKATNLGAKCDAVLLKATGGVFNNTSTVVGNLACGQLEISPSLQTIGASAFQNCSGLTSLDLSDATSLVTIGDAAFEECSGLTGLYLTNATSLQTIGANAFNACSDLTGTLIIPAGITSIGNWAFYECTKLTGLDLLNATSLVTIGDGAFDNCYKLTGTLIIPASVTTIGAEAFKNVNFKTGTLIIPESVTSIGDGAFLNTWYVNINFYTMIPPAMLGTNIFGSSIAPDNYQIAINVPNGAKKAWNEEPDILTKLGIVSLDQIKEFTLPNGIEEITLDKIGPYLFSNNWTHQFDVVKASSKILPLDGDQTIKWSITTKDKITKPNNINIDTNGHITMEPTNGMQPTKYDLTIKATCLTNDIITTSKDIIIYIVSMDPVTFQTPGPIDVENDITIEIPKNKAISAIHSLDANLSFNWTIQDLDFHNAPSWITIKPDGQIYVNNTNAATIGKYEFKVIASCNENGTIIESSEIVVNVIEPTVPPSIEEITFNKAGPYLFNNTTMSQINVVKASSKIFPVYADQSINWSITTKGQITKPDNISIDANGQVTMEPTNGMQPIKYDLTIKATCPTNDIITTSKDIIICIGTMDPVTFQTPGPINVENNITTETPKNKAISAINPLDANFSIKWIIEEDDFHNAPSWITIKPDGQIYVNNTNAAAIGKYDFKVIAICNENSLIKASSNIVINVIEPTVPPSIEEITFNKAGPYLFNNTTMSQINVVKASSKILPADADQTIKWSITTKGQVIDKPDNISIDANGQITIEPTNGMQPIKYDLTIKATCPTDHTITTSKDIIICIGTMDHVTFQTSGPIDVENNITTETPKNKAISAINPLDANLSIKWTIQNLDGTVAPSWITIKPDGQICVNNTNAATIEKYEFKVIATSDENETISASSNIIVNVVEPIIPNPESTNDLNLSLIIGISVGGAVGVAAIAGGITYGVKHNKTKK